jgi:hypothetical protein
MGLPPKGRFHPEKLLAQTEKFAAKAFVVIPFTVNGMTSF